MSKAHLTEVIFNAHLCANLERRFWPKVDRRGDDECWPWQASKNEFGYGRMTAGRGRHLKSHQIAYALHHRKVPELFLRHTCDNPPCCNPRHLIEGTQADNMADCKQRGRKKDPPTFYGSKHHNTKFDEATALSIARDKRAARRVAAENNISEMTVYRLRKGLTWKELPR